MADISSVKDKINTDEVGANKPLSEALNTKYGENINYLIDTTDDHETRVSAIEGSVTRVNVPASPTTLSSYVTIYTCPSNTTSVVQVKFKNLPNAAGSMNCNARAVIDGINVMLISNPSTFNGVWGDNGATTGATGTYLEASYGSTITLVAGDTIQVRRFDRGALELDIVEMQTL